MANSSQEAELISKLAREQDVSEDAVTVVLEALRRGGGTMAQFSHPAFGGMSQWSSGMTMVGDMFNSALKAKLSAIAEALSNHLRHSPAEPPHAGGSAGDRSGRSSQGGSWWPSQFGTPSSSGSQNDMRYAVFPDARRLVIDDHGKIAIFDTGDHRISGVSQAQSAGSTLTFVSQHGIVRVAELENVDIP